MTEPNTAEETKAERCMKSDIATVVNYFEESDLTDEELINLSADMERIAIQHTAQTLDRLKEKLRKEWNREVSKYKEATATTNEEAASYGRLKGYEDAIKLIEEVSDEVY